MALEYGTLVDMETNERLTFQFNPEKINDNTGAQWADNQIAFVHHPRKQYSFGTGRTISFSLRFYGFDDKDNKRPLEKANWLRSTVYPDIIRNSSIPLRAPHRYLFNYGVLYKGLPVVITQANTEFGTLMTEELDPFDVTVELELHEIRTQAIGYLEVRKGKY